MAVIGDEQPIQNVRRRIERELADGERIELDDTVQGFLRERRDQAKQEGSWVERHYRPGQGFRFDR